MEQRSVADSDDDVLLRNVCRPAARWQVDRAGVHVHTAPWISQKCRETLVRRVPRAVQRTLSARRPLAVRVPYTCSCDPARTCEDSSTELQLPASAARCGIVVARSLSEAGLSNELPSSSLTVLLPCPSVCVDVRGCDIVLTALRRNIALHTANAYISTLGGGHFLCRHVKQAIRLATMQAHIARLLGDHTHMARVHVHLVYCAVQMGLFRTAARMLSALHRVSMATGDEVLTQMVSAGRRYTTHTHTLWREGKLRLLRGTTREDTIAFNDELYRQHIVLPS